MVEGGDLLTITLLVLAHLIIGKSTILPHLHFNSSGVSWESAANECGQYGLENDQHTLRNIHELEGKKFWIGEKVYHVTLPWMEILGCFAVNTITSTHHNISLGQCQRQCMVSTYFGYKEETRECVCLRERGYNGSFDNCINRNMGSRFFVYTNFSGSSFGSDPADGKNCMKSYCSDKGYVNFVKVNCNTTDGTVKGVCEDGSPAITAITEPPQQFWGKTKSVIMERCRRNHKLLPSSLFCNGTGFQVWTNVFRVEEDFDIETDDAGEYKPIGCVAATLNNSVLYKRRISCDAAVNYFVCKQMHNVDVETTSIQNSESGTMGSDQMIGTKTVPIGAIAGGIAGFLVAVSLTVVSLMICRRRQVCMFQLKKNPSNMLHTHADISNTTSSSLKRSTDADVNGSNTVNNSGNFHADLVYSKEEAYQKSNTIDTESSLDLDCYDHLNASNTRETMLNEHLYSSNVGPRSNTDPTYDYSTMGTIQRKDTNSIYDHTLESMNNSNVGFRKNTDPTYDDSTMCTIQGKNTNNIYNHTLEHMYSTCSNIDDVYAVSSKLKPAK